MELGEPHRPIRLLPPGWSLRRLHPGRGVVPDAAGDLALPPGQARRPGRADPLRLRRRRAAVLAPIRRHHSHAGAYDWRDQPIQNTRHTPTKRRRQGGQGVRGRCGAKFDKAAAKITDDEAEVLASKLLESAERRWRMVNVPHLVALVRAGRPSSAATWSSDPTSMRGLIEVGIVRAGGRVVESPRRADGPRPHHRPGQRRPAPVLAAAPCPRPTACFSGARSTRYRSWPGPRWHRDLSPTASTWPR